jgi:hypothetical protein
MTNAWLSEYYGNKLMKNLLNGTSLTGPSSLYMGLGTGPASTDEISGGTYTRQVVTFATITTALYAATTVDVLFTGVL